jgi:hypothetical protein
MQWRIAHQPADTSITRPFLKIRKGYLDVLAAGRRKNIIHGLIDIDVRELRRVLREREAAAQPLPSTAALLYAVAKAVDEDRIMHAYRRRNRIICSTRSTSKPRSRWRFRARRS